MMPRESARGRLRSHEACLNCRYGNTLVYLWVELISIQKKEDPMSGRETVLLKLCPPKSSMPLYHNT